MNDRKALTRITWLYNHDAEDEAWLVAANRAGYKVDRAVRERHVEYRLSREGATVGVIHAFPDEAFLFLWEREADAPLWRRLTWRLAHPLTPLRPLPWPRKVA